MVKLPEHGQGQSHLMADPRAIKDFMLAGKAVLTLKSTTSGKHYTYRIKQAPDGALFFVALCTGDNEFGYSYIGQITAYNGQHFYSHGRKSTIAEGSKPAQALRWAFNALLQGRVPQGLEVWHEGRCAACARVLTDPTSLATGLGPECSDRRGVARGARAKARDKTPFATLKQLELV